MAATATSLGAPAEADAADRARAPNREFIVNVSAMEESSTGTRPPTTRTRTWRKPWLNMMTATSAADYKNDNVYMNAVDTGWINDENPRHVAARIAKEHEFQTPIDEEDAAARCVAPILEGVRDAAEPPFGKFFKDYRERVVTRPRRRREPAAKRRAPLVSYADRLRVAIPRSRRVFARCVSSLACFACFLFRVFRVVLQTSQTRNREAKGVQYVLPYK